MKARLQAELDVAIRLLLWTVVFVVAVVAIEPTALYLPGSPLVGLVAVCTYLALAHLAIGLALAALGRAPGDAVPAGDGAGPWTRLGPGGAMTFKLMSHGAAVLLCGLGSLPGDAASAVPWVTFRLGGVLLALGLVVLTPLGLQVAPRHAPTRALPESDSRW